MAPYRGHTGGYCTFVPVHSAATRTQVVVTMNCETNENPKHYCVYILSCADGSFYTGMTNDLPRRLAEHRAGRGAQWTRRRRPVELVFLLDALSYRSAREVER